MTAAQLRAAAEIMENAALMDNEVVTVSELGSEGIVFYAGSRGPRYWISRDGTYRCERDK